MKKTISMILILVLIAATLVGCGSKYTDGTHEGEGQGMSTIKVSVTVEEGKITDVQVLEHEESEGYSEEALKDIPALIVEKNSTDVDAISGATLTSDGIKEAVKNALDGAK